MSVQSIPTIFWYQPQAQRFGPENRCQTYQQALAQAGFTVQPMSQALELYQEVAETLSNNRQVPVICLVSGGGNDVLAVIARLRVKQAQLPILVELPDLDEAKIAQALYCGADQYCLSNTSPDLWVATVSSLLRRARASLSSVPLATPQAPSQQTEDHWKLLDEGWLLAAPTGQQITLTTTERQLMRTLLQQPDRRASHQQLLGAISNGDESEDQAIAHNRLGVVISRLKRKGQTANMIIPIRSVYKWGYMFGAIGKPI